MRTYFVNVSNNSTWLIDLWLDINGQLQVKEIIREHEPGTAFTTCIYLPHLNYFHHHNNIKNNYFS